LADYVGGYSDWVRQRPAALFATEPATPAKTAPAPAATSAPATAEPKRKLSYKDARELEQLPARIESLETEIAQRTAAMNDPAFYQQDAAALLKANEALAALQADLDTAYRRWSELDG
jgi:ATP-binding cassette subfamily F protein uup